MSRIATDEQNKIQQLWLLNKTAWNLENLPEVFLNMMEDGQLNQWDMNIRIFRVKGFRASVRVEKKGGLTHDGGTIINDPTEFSRFIKIYKKLRDALKAIQLNNANKE